MAKRNNVFDFHSFYCPKCGQKVLDLPRKRGRQHERFHRKKLYCFNCKVELNCIECKSDNDIFDFKQSFENGEFKEEAENSIMECNNIGQKFNI